MERSLLTTVLDFVNIPKHMEKIPILLFGVLYHTLISYMYRDGDRGGYGGGGGFGGGRGGGRGRSRSRSRSRSRDRRRRSPSK